MKQAEQDGKAKIFDDVSDAASAMSMSHTMSQMNFIPLDADLDNILDQMLQNQNPVHLAKLEKQRDEHMQMIK